MVRFFIAFLLIPLQRKKMRSVSGKMAWPRRIVKALPPSPRLRRAKEVLKRREPASDWRYGRQGLHSGVSARGVNLLSARKPLPLASRNADRRAAGRASDPP